MIPSYDQRQASAVRARCEVCGKERYYTSGQTICSLCRMWFRAVQHFARLGYYRRETGA